MNDVTPMQQLPPQLSVLLDKLNGKIYVVVSRGPFDIKNPANIAAKIDLEYTQAFELGLSLLTNFKLAYTIDGTPPDVNNPVNTPTNIPAIEPPT